MAFIDLAGMAARKRLFFESLFGGITTSEMVHVKCEICGHMFEQELTVETKICPSCLGEHKTTTFKQRLDDKEETLTLKECHPGLGISYHFDEPYVKRTYDLERIHELTRERDRKDERIRELERELERKDNDLRLLQAKDASAQEALRARSAVDHQSTTRFEAVLKSTKQERERYTRQIQNLEQRIADLLKRENQHMELHVLSGKRIDELEIKCKQLEYVIAGMKRNAQQM